MTSPELGGYEHPIFNTPAGREFRGLLASLESRAEMDARNVFSHEYTSLDGKSILHAYVDEPVVDFFGGSETQHGGNIIFEIFDDTDGHFIVGEGDLNQEIQARMLLEKITANQPGETETWIRSLYGAIDTDDEGSVARQSLIDTPDTVDTVFLANYFRQTSGNQMISFVRRDRFANVDQNGQSIKAESRIRLILVDVDGTLFHCNWDLLSQTVKVTSESNLEWLSRIDTRKPHPALDIDVPPDDPRVIPTEAKLEAFAAAIKVMEGYWLEYGPEDT